MSKNEREGQSVYFTYKDEDELRKSLKRRGNFCFWEFNDLSKEYWKKKKRKMGPGKLDLYDVNPS